MAWRDRDERPEIEVLGVTPGSGDEHVVELGSERSSRRGWVIGGVVAALLLVVGLTTGDDGTDETEGTKGTPPREADLSTSTTRPRPSTTTTLPGAPLPSLGPLVDDVDGWQLLLQSDGARGSVLVDLETGNQSRVDIPRNDGFVQAVAGGIVALDGGIARFQPLPSGEEVELGAVEQVARGADPDTVWLIEPADPPERYRVRLVDTRGRLRAGPFDSTDGWIGSPTEDGYLEVKGGQIFHVTDDGSEHLAAGTLLGSNAEFAVVEQCDEDHDCAVNLVDLDDGRSRAMRGPKRMLLGFGSAEVPPSERGEVAFVFYGPRGMDLTIVDGRSGRSGSLASTGFVSLLGWLPNGKGLLMMNERTIERVTLGDGPDLVRTPLAGIEVSSMGNYGPMLIPR